MVFLDELPRNPTGKVLKRELAEDAEDAGGVADAGGAADAADAGDAAEAKA